MSDVLFTNARVFTGEEFSAPQSVAVRNGRILAVGTAAAVPGLLDAASLDVGSPDAGARTVDLGGKHLMPGFVESHGHPAMFGLTLRQVDVKPAAVQSIEEIKKAVQIAVIDAQPGEWIQGHGWDETYVLDGRAPTRDDLDEVAPDNPVVLTRTCGHVILVNSAALRVSGVPEDVADPEGGAFVRDASGRLTGIVQEQSAKELIRNPTFTEEQLEEGLVLAQERFNAWGVTTVNDLFSNTAFLGMYRKLDADGRLTVRMRPWMGALEKNHFPGHLAPMAAAGISSGFGDDMIRIQGVKLQLDGSMGGRTAAVCTPFEGTEETGILLLPRTEDLAAHCRLAADHDIRMAIHAIGDAAIGQMFDALDMIDRAEWIAGSRLRIEHCGMPTDAQLDRMAEWNMVASSSVGFVYHLGDSYLNVLDAERAARCYPHRSFIDRGIVAPGNSDVPVTNGNPWEGIYGAVTRTTRTGQVLDTVQNITLAEAIRAYTLDGAWANFEEDVAGSIEVGKFADLQVYAENPFELEPEAWLGLSPESVWLAGREVYAR
ncbi:amidohydrolase [Brevibacterium samyangense]|uniref:Amidohydrolase n=1 Tax=Brevibacterium samyangense TaxID=366888 RepID=A0ABN2T843_9MICO